MNADVLYCLYEEDPSSFLDGLDFWLAAGALPICIATMTIERHCPRIPRSSGSKCLRLFPTKGNLSTGRPWLPLDSRMKRTRKFGFYSSPGKAIRRAINSAIRFGFPRLCSPHCFLRSRPFVLRKSILPCSCFRSSRQVSCHQTREQDPGGGAKSYQSRQPTAFSARCLLLADYLLIPPCFGVLPIGSRKSE